ncbi:MAG TPA: glycosyltransferase family 39 protein [Candidatus Acidoferrum sp.]|nr:glycosyltransferase family 39 protein [Candidatus Acidoferrum sp.]
MLDTMPTSMSQSLSSARLTIAWILGAVAFVIQAELATRYGYFRDELYFIACSDHLAAGYVDFAPLSAWLLHFNRVLFGDSLHALRLLPDLAFGAEVVLAGYIARELGARSWGVFLACVSVMCAPVISGGANRYSMNSFEPLFWMGSIYFLLLALNREKPQLLVGCGVLFGLGLENKHSAVFFLGALVFGLLLSAQRRVFASKWFWLAAAIALLIAAPNAVWQVQHHFPTLEDLHNVKVTHKNIELPPLAFLGQQIMMLSPFSVLVWLAGLGFLLFHREARPFRFLGFTYLAFLAVMMLLHGKDYYLAPIYPMLYAAGGVFWEKLTEPQARPRWLRIAVPAVVIAGGIIAAPLALPILPPDRIVPYMAALGIRMSRTETTMTGLLPQHFADEFGWEEMVKTVADVYHSLPPEQQAKTAILGGNYGGAGAIDFFGARYGLPKSISAHQNYYYWGPREYTGESVILLEWNLKDAQYWCGSVQEGPKNAPYYGMGWEHYTILICRDFKKPLAEAWPRLKVWN